MKDKELDKLLKEKAKNMELSSYTKTNAQDIIRIAKAKKRKAILQKSFVASLCACLVVGILIYLAIIKSIENDIKEISIEANNKNGRNEEIVGTYIYAPNGCIEKDKEICFLAIVNIEKIEFNGIIDAAPKTIIQSKIEENFLGENIEYISFSLESCTLKYKEIPENVKSAIIFEDVIKDDDTIRIIMDKDLDFAIPQIGKYYIVTLTKINGNYEVLDNTQYPFYEYDINTKKVKIKDEWRDLNVKLLLR